VDEPAFSIFSTSHLLIFPGRHSYSEGDCIYASRLPGRVTLNFLPAVTLSLSKGRRWMNLPSLSSQLLTFLSSAFSPPVHHSPEPVEGAQVDEPAFSIFSTSHLLIFCIFPSCPP